MTSVTALINESEDESQVIELHLPTTEIKCIIERIMKD